MKRGLILVEGPTEERFVKDVLSPYLLGCQLALTPTVIPTKRMFDGTTFKGGISHFDQINKAMRLLLRGSGGALVTTMIDYYRLAVVEAKRESIDPLSAKEQARSYAAGLGVSHIFLSNGLVHYYWNLRQGNPVKMSRFLPLEELGKAAEWKPDSARLAAVTVDENYIAVSQDSATTTPATPVSA